MFTHLLPNKKRYLHPLVVFLAARHDDITYNFNWNSLPVEDWTYILSAFYQRLPFMLCDPELAFDVKIKLDTYNMLISSPQWFQDNSDFFMGLHLIEFGKYKSK